MTEHVLDNAAWHSLGGAHAVHAEGGAAARRYLTDVSVFAATPDDGVASWDALAELAAGEVVVLFRGIPVSPRPGWRIVFSGEGTQFVAAPVLSTPPRLPSSDHRTGLPIHLRELAADDVPAMVALVALTEPGPFRPRTIELGGYQGIFHGDRLVAMAGQRMRPDGWCEVSAVCTHPDARRRGYAALLTWRVSGAIQARGERAFLHIAADNDAARSVYRELGYSERRSVSFAVLQPPR